MSHADDVFYRQFGAVLILIIISAFAAYFIAQAIGGPAIAKIQQSPGALEQRIAPVGAVATAKMEQEAAVPVKAAEPVKAAAPAKVAPPKVAAVAVAATPADGVGRKTFNAACGACHIAGVANAPKLGDKVAWGKRSAQGLDALYDSGIKGKGALMPAKGGNASLSDDDVKAAVRYMLKEAGVNAG